MTLYQALYRKYRPVTFDDVISQAHITTTLKNQIIGGKTAHAYLFTGSRGTGKTTCARIFAKALNCESPADGSPCNCCANCIDADNFALSDIIEIDAASNNSVGDARELREAAVYTPERCRYKVYIIDEVHMLTKDAFNALLKIIEEPPPHIKFIMATTELHKVLPTILSRCQRFDFRRIRSEDIASRLSDIAAKEGFSIDADGAALIARAADGGMRDALSILDRCIAFSDNVTAEVVSETAGIAGRDSIFSICRSISGGDTASALQTVSQLYENSKDMRQLVSEISEQIRNIMIAISAPSQAELISCLPGESDTIKDIAASFTLEKALDCLDILGDCAERMSRSLSKRADMEMCIIRMCSGARKPSAATAQDKSTSADKELISMLTARIAALEEQIRNGIPSDQSKSRPKPLSNTTKEQVTDMTSVSNTPVYEPKWPDIIDRLRESCPSLAPTLLGSYGYSAGAKFLINTKNTLLKTLIRSDENRGRVLSAIQEISGKTFTGVVVGYRAEFDRSPVKDSDPQETVSDPAENLRSMLEKARSSGIEVETI